MNEQPSNERFAKPAVKDVEDRQQSILAAFDAPLFFISVSSHPRVQTSLPPIQKKRWPSPTLEIEIAV